jgi:hypothetical protein
MKSLRPALAFACLLATLCAFAPPALADDPPITTVPTPTVPEPEPAPAPTPAPPVKKPPPPKKSTPAPRPTQPAPTTNHASTPALAVVTPAAPIRPRSTPKPKKKAVHRKKKVHKKVAPRTLPTPDRPVPAKGASAGLLPAAPGTKAGSSFNIGGLFVILGCALAITCFGVALVPATAVPWRGVAGFIAHRQFDLTVTGLTLLVAVVAFYFLAGV